VQSEEGRSNPSIDATRDDMGRSGAMGSSSVPRPTSLMLARLERWASESTRPRAVALLTIALFLLASIAFWPQYLSKSWSSIDRYTHAHAILGTAWLLVLIVQPLLIVRGSRAAHRIIGQTSLLVAVSFVVSGVLLAHFRISRMPDDIYAKEGIYIYLPLAVALLFALAAGMGFHWRHSAAIHARFMVATALLLVDPVLARIMYFYLPPLPDVRMHQGITFAFIAVVLTFLVRSLPPTVQGRRAYRGFCLGTGLTLALFFAVPQTDMWLAFTHWFRALPMT